MSICFTQLGQNSHFLEKGHLMAAATIDAEIHEFSNTLYYTCIKYVLNTYRLYLIQSDFGRWMYLIQSVVFYSDPIV